ncbi:hypothetical protein, partial [Escherichia coli]|uniref:hypothetical protein n=1 Tax=Escherichia coli TaxID=562 RepID=UPI0039F70AA8
CQINFSSGTVLSAIISSASFPHRSWLIHFLAMKSPAGQTESIEENMRIAVPVFLGELMSE